MRRYYNVNNVNYIRIRSLTQNSKNTSIIVNNKKKKNKNKINEIN